MGACTSSEHPQVGQRGLVSELWQALKLLASSAKVTGKKKACLVGINYRTLEYSRLEACHGQEDQGRAARLHQRCEQHAEGASAM